MEASALPEEARARFVEQAAGEDTALRDEVLSLLGWHATESNAVGPAVGTLLFPDRAHRQQSTRWNLSKSTPGLPADLLSQSAGRVRIVALLYAFGYFVSDPLQSLLLEPNRAAYFSNFATWGPGAIAIPVALLVAVFIRNPRISPSALTYLSLAFEIVGSYGIAASEYLPTDFTANGPQGLSWVAVWTLLFTIVVPAPSRLAVTAALASVSAAPVMIWTSLIVRNQPLHPTLLQFAFGVVLPYVLVAGMSAIGARAVYSLGKEVKRARELGSYRLVERLGTGGMGEIWRASHAMLARPAAIKLIRPTMTADGTSTVSDEARRRFEREAQVIARLRSPHTVTLFDFGIAADGAFYYVMELLDGLDADTLVRRHGPIPAERVIHVLRQVCHSLSEAESRGLVHRDIKPANIFLCRYGEEHDFVKVLDFGIVKTIGDGAERGATLTGDIGVRGTPAFMAPEQALGESTVDGRADIYATGCVAYWLLTGHLVFAADTAVGLLVHHAKSVPIRPSAVTEQPIPPALERIVMSCLAKDPNERLQTARELARQLAEVKTADTWSDERAREWWQLHEPVPAGRRA